MEVEMESSNLNPHAYFFPSNKHKNIWVLALHTVW